MEIDCVNDLITSLRRCASGGLDCEGCEGKHCDEHKDRLMRESADVLEVLMRDMEWGDGNKNPAGCTYTTPEIIRLVQHVVGNTLDSLDVDDDGGMRFAYEIEHGIVAELVKEKPESPCFSCGECQNRLDKKIKNAMV